MLSKRLLALLLIVPLLSSCGYQGWVRYPCQEVANWENQECKHPDCDVTGTCPEDLLPEVFENEP